MTITLQNQTEIIPGLRYLTLDISAAQIEITIRGEGNQIIDTFTYPRPLVDGVINTLATIIQQKEV